MKPKDLQLLILSLCGVVALLGVVVVAMPQRQPELKPVFTSTPEPTPVSVVINRGQVHTQPAAPPTLEPINPSVYASSQMAIEGYLLFLKNLNAERAQLSKASSEAFARLPMLLTQNMMNEFDQRPASQQPNAYEESYRVSMEIVKAQERFLSTLQNANVPPEAKGVHQSYIAIVNNTKAIIGQTGEFTRRLPTMSKEETRQYLTSRKERDERRKENERFLFQTFYAEMNELVKRYPATPPDLWQIEVKD